MKIYLSQSWELSDEHSASIEGRPVLVNKKSGEAYGPGDIIGRDRPVLDYVTLNFWPDVVGPRRIPAQDVFGKVMAKGLMKKDPYLTRPFSEEEKKLVSRFYLPYAVCSHFLSCSPDIGGKKLYAEDLSGNKFRCNKCGKEIEFKKE